MKKLVVMALAFATISLGPLTAHATCGTAADESAATIPVSTVAADQGDIYIDASPGLWQESNGQAGLQKEQKMDGSTVCWDADTNVAAVPAGVPPVPGAPDPGSLPIPALPVP